MATTEGLRKARRAGTLTRRIAGHRARQAEAARERRRLLLEANRGGVTYAQLAEIAGIDPSLVATQIRDAKIEEAEAAEADVG